MAATRTRLSTLALTLAISTLMMGYGPHSQAKSIPVPTSCPSSTLQDVRDNNGDKAFNTGRSLAQLAQAENESDEEYRERVRLIIQKYKGWVVWSSDPYHDLIDAYCYFYVEGAQSGALKPNKYQADVIVIDEVFGVRPRYD